MPRAEDALKFGAQQRAVVGPQRLRRAHILAGILELEVDRGVAVKNVAQKVFDARHLAALAQIEKACFHAPWSEAMLREELGKGIFLVAERDGQAVGYVGCQTVLDEGYITNVAVSPDCRRQGVGRALIAALTAEGVARYECD